MTSLARRHRRDRIMTAAMILAVLIAVVPLALILAEVVAKGVGQLSWSFFTQAVPFVQTAPGGGYAAGIQGTIKMVVLATIIAVPIGVLAAVYLTEYKTQPVLATTVHFFADVMTGIPSIFVGIFVFTVVVLTTGSFSAWAGALALAILMLPLIVRTSEEALRLVPDTLREASLALGVRKWRTIISVVLPTALPGITTGALLAVARAAGETAPLLLTSFGNQLIVPFTSFNGPQAALTLQIFTDSRSPFPAQQNRAWTGALVLIFGVLVLSVIARTIATRRSRGAGRAR
ncbi:MAG TPA: phosphate ABC transporter permease PstA [Streptosporangiaceae bacterium]|jgi:phosphate transport system permease protein|nr:phosphate ABC transporter permease PstA [Streptosporangiaceae bacterium]